MIKYNEMKDSLDIIMDNQEDVNMALCNLVNLKKVEPKKMTALEEAREYFKTLGEFSWNVDILVKLYEKAIDEARQIDADVIDWLITCKNSSTPEKNKKNCRKLLDHFGVDHE